MSNPIPVPRTCSETELSTPESPADQLEDFNQQDAVMREYEKRALNFLVNEYTLTNNYKLTSVTFAEENEDQVRRPTELNESAPVASRYRSRFTI